MKVLVTGFEPFGGEVVNPSWQAVSCLPDSIDDVRIIKAESPVAFYDSAKVVIELIKEHEPDVVVMVGQRGKSTEISCERLAINVADASKPDNLGAQPEDELIAEEGPMAYLTTTPLKKIVKSLNDACIPATVSNSTGTYVCNYLYYSILHYCKTHDLKTTVGFYHVPYLPEQVVGKKLPSMCRCMMTEALEIIIKTIIKEKR